MSQIKQRVANSIFKLLPQQGTTYCINEPVTVPADFCGMNYINYPSPLATGYYTPNPYSVGAPNPLNWGCLRGTNLYETKWSSIETVSMLGYIVSNGSSPATLYITNSNIAVNGIGMMHHTRQAASCTTGSIVGNIFTPGGTQVGSFQVGMLLGGANFGIQNNADATCWITANLGNGQYRVSTSLLTAVANQVVNGYIIGIVRSGQSINCQGLPINTTIVSGSGNVWNLSKSVSSNIGSITNPVPIGMYDQIALSFLDEIISFQRANHKTFMMCLNVVPWWYSSPLAGITSTYPDNAAMSHGSIAGQSPPIFIAGGFKNGINSYSSCTISNGSGAAGNIFIPGGNTTGNLTLNVGDIIYGTTSGYITFNATITANLGNGQWQISTSSYYTTGTLVNYYNPTIFATQALQGLTNFVEFIVARYNVPGGAWYNNYFDTLGKGIQYFEEGNEPLFNGNTISAKGSNLTNVSIQGTGITYTGSPYSSYESLYGGGCINGATWLDTNYNQLSAPSYTSSSVLTQLAAVSGSTFWSGTPSQLVDMCYACYLAVKAIDPSITVLSPGLTYSIVSNINPFMQAYGTIYSSIQGKQCFDAFAYHPYFTLPLGMNFGSWTLASYGDIINGQTTGASVYQLQAYLNQNNMNTPIYITEWGFDSSGNSTTESAWYQQEITAISWSSGVVTVTTKYNHYYAINDSAVITGIYPNGYNGTVTVTGIPSPNQFTYNLTINPGTTGTSTGGQFTGSTSGTLITISGGLIGTLTPYQWLVGYESSNLLILGQGTDNNWYLTNSKTINNTTIYLNGSVSNVNFRYRWIARFGMQCAVMGVKQVDYFAWMLPNPNTVGLTNLVTMDSGNWQTDFYGVVAAMNDMTTKMCGKTIATASMTYAGPVTLSFTDGTTWTV